MRPDGRLQRNITRHPASDRNPVFGPRGDRLAFASDRDGDFEIYSILSNGNGLRRLTDDPGRDTIPDWSRPPAVGTGRSRCTIRGTSGNDIIRGTARDDVICAGAGNDVVYGGGGNDTLSGGSGNNILRGERGDDRVFGGAGADVVRGGSGNDVLSGGDGADQVIGGSEDDHLRGGPGRDVLSGQDGRDYLNTRDDRGGNDVANGGAGEDSCETDRGDARSSC